MGVATAAVVLVALLVGSNLIGPPPASAPPTAATPSVEASGVTNLPEGPLIWLDTTPVELPVDPQPPDDGPSITVTIPATGWSLSPEFLGLSKGDNADPPEAAMLPTSTTAGLYVYSDPCRWASTKPDTPVTTVDEIVAAMADQPSRDTSEPVDVTVGGYRGKLITLRVPTGANLAACDEQNFATYAIDGGGDGPWRYHQGVGQIETFWVIDVDGAVVVIDAMYRPDTPAQLIDEMRAIAESATFEAP